MSRTIAATLVATFAAGAALAFGGEPNDDDNDYEGRVEKDEETYFGFDLSSNGNKVKGISAYLHYKCDGGTEGNALVETEGELKVNENGKFSGKTKGQSKINVKYEVAGKLGKRERASGTIVATGNLGPAIECRSPNDGEWRARRGRDINLITR